MLLVHWSKYPLTSVEDAHPHPGELAFKPNGIWVSVGDGDDGWRAWCIAENFRTFELVYGTQIVLHDDANIIRLTNAEEIDAFTVKYTHPKLPSYYLMYGIDWAKVAEEFDGIIIAPYIWQRRLAEHAMWYYSWDCASGCIWRKRAVKELKPYHAPAEAMSNEQTGRPIGEYGGHCSPVQQDCATERGNPDDPEVGTGL